MKIWRGKLNNQHKQFNKNITLEASNLYVIPFTFPLFEYLAENYFLSIDMKVLLVPSSLLLLIFIVLLTKRGYRWWDPNQKPIPPKHTSREP